MCYTMVEFYAGVSRGRPSVRCVTPWLSFNNLSLVVKCAFNNLQPVAINVVAKGFRNRQSVAFLVYLATNR
jgi:hypothetical protein